MQFLLYGVWKVYAVNYYYPSLNFQLTVTVVNTAIQNL